MPERVLDLLEKHKAEMVGEIMEEVKALSPYYEQVPAVELRRNVVILLTLLFNAARSSNERQLMNTLAEISQKRVKEDLDLGGFLNAMHAVFPVFARFVREKGEGDSEILAHAYRVLENKLHQISSKIATLYANTMQEKFAVQNKELQELNKLLQLKKENLSKAIEKKDRELIYQTEINRRVLESMQAGVCVVGKDFTVIYFSERLGEMIGVQAATCVGKNVQEVLKNIGGLNLPEMAAVVYRDGRLPMAQYDVTTAAQQTKKVYIRAESYMGYEGGGDGVVIIVDDITEKEMLASSFERYVSRDILQSILKQNTSPWQGECCNCTILFADIRGFTGFTEGMSLTQIHALLNVYLGMMGKAIERHGGFIDKFIGDKILAVFRAKEETESATAALQAASQMQDEIQEWSQTHPELPPISVGIGVNTGEVLMGNVGSENRLDFTVIGDPVNVADRLQEKAIGGEILCGSETAKLSGTTIKSFLRSTEILRGCKESSEIFQVERRRKQR